MPRSHCCRRPLLAGSENVPGSQHQAGTTASPQTPRGTRHWCCSPRCSVGAQVANPSPSSGGRPGGTTREQSSPPGPGTIGGQQLQPSQQSVRPLQLSSMPLPQISPVPVRVDLSKYAVVAARLSQRATSGLAEVARATLVMTDSQNVAAPNGPVRSRSNPGLDSPAARSPKCVTVIRP